MSEISVGSPKRSGGILKGVNSASDEWMAHIVRSSWRDRITNPMSCFSRKGFYDLSVQSIIND